MTRNPYAQLGTPAQGGYGTGVGGPGMGGGGPYDPGFDAGPSRTSALAVASLVFGLVCVIPGAGLLAVLLGVPALFLINASRGRLRGTGLAVAGVCLGLLFSAMWVLGLYGAAWVNRQVGVAVLLPVKDVMVGVEAGDATKAKALFTPSVAPTITQEDLDRFRTAYQAELGSFKSMPESLWDMMKAYMEVGQAMQGYQSPSRPIFPVPATFDKGMTLVLVEGPPHQRGPHPAPPGGKSGMSIDMVNLGVLTPSGKEIWLIDTGTTAPATSVPPSPAPTPPDEPAETPTDAPSSPEPPAAPPPG